MMCTYLDDQVFERLHISGIVFIVLILQSPSCACSKIFHAFIAALHLVEACLISFLRNFNLLFDALILQFSSEFSL